MLKAAIIYVQGSGGNLLARSLTLNQGTVAFLPKTLAQQQPTYNISAQDRLHLYNNWDNTNWVKSEDEICLWYHRGLNDFVNYELSSLDLIDPFHPMMFDEETKKALLWTSVSQWQHVIFVKYQPHSLDMITTLASRKRTDRQHKNQIPSEIKTYHELLNTIPDHLDIWWEDMLELDTFTRSVMKLSNSMNLNVEIPLVQQLWKSWSYHTRKILL